MMMTQNQVEETEPRPEGIIRRVSKYFLMNLHITQ